MARNRVIGRDNAIPWHLPDELRLFKSLTMGHHIVMGRRTFESIGRLLPGRTSVIVTRQRDFEAPGTRVSHSVSEALAACRDDDEIFVIGGADLFRETLPLADRLYLTIVDAEPEGDTFMPEFDFAEWRLREERDFPADARHAHGYSFRVYDRIREPDA
jgi:dihydrofolate reductase